MKNEPLTYEEKLQEQYEDALFALMMHNFAVQQGEKYMEENERLKQDPEAAMPEDMERRCLETIETELNKKGKIVHIHSFKRVITYVAAAIILVTLLVGGAIAVSDEFRVEVINFLMEMDDEKATFQFVSEEESDTFSILPTPASDSEMPDIEVAWMAEGFIRATPEKDQFHSSIEYVDADGDTIIITVHRGTNVSYGYDIEDADYITACEVQERSALLVEKEELTSIAWADEKEGLMFCVESLTEDASVLKQVAESVTVRW